MCARSMCDEPEHAVAEFPHLQQSSRPLHKSQRPFPVDLCDERLKPGFRTPGSPFKLPLLRASGDALQHSVREDCPVAVSRLTPRTLAPIDAPPGRLGKDVFDFLTAHHILTSAHSSQPLSLFESRTIPMRSVRFEKEITRTAWSAGAFSPRHSRRTRCRTPWSEQD
jgi:hypothetical protein